MKLRLIDTCRAERLDMLRLLIPKMAINHHCRYTCAFYIAETHPPTWIVRHA